MADVFEALTAGIYLDTGIENARKFVLDNVANYVEEYIESGDNKDYKTRLQHIVQEKYSIEPRYLVRGEKGPAHDKTFNIEVYIKEKLSGKGKGKSKKKAQQNAAMNALKKYDRRGSF